MRDRIVKGGIALSLRQFISLPLNAVGLGVASIWLTATDFGVLAILTVLINLALIVVDLGTSNALVQSPVEPSAHLLRQVQWYKSIAGFGCTLLYGLLWPRIGAYYNLPDWMILLIPCCGLVAWLQSQRGYQSIKLQRRVEWQLLARVEMIEILAYNLVLVVSTYLLRSPLSFILSMGVRAGLGATILSRVRVPPQQTLATGGNLRGLLGFGVPYQATTALSMIQKSMNPIIVGSLAGISAVGLINWSNYIVSLAMLPFQPFYSFLFTVVAERQRQGKDDNEIIQIVTRIGSVLITLISLVIILLLPYLVEHVFGNQWRDAIPVAWILLIGNTIMLPSLLIPTNLTAKGHSVIWLKVVTIETILIWIVGGLGTIMLGLLGYAIGLLVASIIVLAIECALAKRIVGLHVRFFDSILLMTFASLSVLASSLAGYFLSEDTCLLGGVLRFIIGVGFFLGLLALVYFKQIKQDWLILRRYAPHLLIKNDQASI
jgi:O-antigen/teichoic acid export membrane protein